MKCAKCGTDADGKFCPNCGEPLPKVSSKVKGKSKKKKPLYKRVWFWVLVGLFLFMLVIVNCGKTADGVKAGMESEGNTPEQIIESVAESAPNSAVAAEKTPIEEAEQKETEETVQKTEEPQEDFSQVEKTYQLGAGHYTVGIDIPAGKCDIAAIEGQGNVSSSNMYSGGINEVFGKDDGSGFYTESFTGLKLSQDVVLSIGGSVIVQLEYTKITGGYVGRTYDEANAITLSSGNYEAGSDFDAGVYTIVAVSGNGNISSTNLYDGGVNEVFGIDDDTSFYIERVENVDLPVGTELSIGGGLNIKFIPAN